MNKTNTDTLTIINFLFVTVTVDNKFCPSGWVGPKSCRDNIIKGLCTITGCLQFFVFKYHVLSIISDIFVW